jgi:plastocyanin
MQYWVAISSLCMVAAPLSAQRLIEATPNTRSPWTMGRWEPALVLSHRLEFVAGGDELLNLPLITVGTAVSPRVAMGIDFSSNSEATTRHLGGNEAQWWMSFRGPTGARAEMSSLVAYNSAAESIDGALTTRLHTGALSWIAEARGFSNAFGEGAAGVAGAAGVVFRFTPYLAIGGDVGQAFGTSNLGNAWSAGVTLALPGTRHQFLFHAANNGPATLQGASRPKVVGPSSTRYGFAFLAPLGTVSQWAKIFRRERQATAVLTQPGVARVNLRDLAFRPDTVWIVVGDSVVWENSDQLVHTVAAADGKWSSGFLSVGQRYARVFAEPGQYAYVCGPHPHMRGVVIVRP